MQIQMQTILTPNNNSDICHHGCLQLIFFRNHPLNREVWGAKLRLYVLIPNPRRTKFCSSSNAQFPGNREIPDYGDSQMSAGEIRMMKSSTSIVADNLCACERNLRRKKSLNIVANCCTCHFAAICRNELDMHSIPLSDRALLDYENAVPANNYRLEDDDEIMTWIPLLPAGILRQSSHSQNTEEKQTTTVSVPADDPPMPNDPTTADRRPSSNPFLSGSMKAASLSQQNRSRRRSYSSASYDRSVCPFISKTKGKIRTHYHKRVDQACSLMSIIDVEEVPTSVPEIKSLPFCVPVTNELRWINSVKSLVLQ